MPDTTTILVAADGQWIRDLVRSAFVAPGQDVIEVRRGQDVIDAVGRSTPDLVILDLQIGNMGGIATFLHLQQEAEDGRLPAVPVLMLLDRPADVPMTRRVGVEGWLIKPLDAFRLRKEARALLDGGTFHEPSGLATSI